jgi:N-acetylmuramoyl-L-alanine amidase
VSAPSITGKPKHRESFYTRRQQTSYITVHCAATSAHWDGDVDEVRQWHVKERGWKDVGYHFFIKRDGTIQVGRPRWAVGAHVEGHNHHALGVCMAGGSDEDGKEENNFTDEQWESLAQLLAYLKREFYPHAKINGHRDFPGVKKYCPSFDVKGWLATGALETVA